MAVTIRVAIAVLCPDRSLQTSPVRNAQLGFRLAYQPSITEIFEQSCNRLATRSDHLRHFAMRVCARNVCRTAYRCEVVPLQKESGEFISHRCRQSERTYLEMRLLIIAAHLMQRVQRSFMMRFDEPYEVFSLDEADEAVVDDMRRFFEWRSGDDRTQTENFSRLRHSQDDRFAFFGI